jgi:hypothetical protein
MSSLIKMVNKFLLSLNLKTFKEPKESIPLAWGRYDNPICRTGPPGYIWLAESIPGR